MTDMADLLREKLCAKIKERADEVERLTAENADLRRGAWDITELKNAEIEELKAQRERLLAVLNQGMTLIDHLMGELARQQGGRKLPFAVELANKQFDDAMRALLAAPASQGSASDLSPDASAGDPA